MGEHCTTEKLARIRKFSDLTLACEGQTFNVHKSICCYHSPEAETSSLTINFDLDSVLRLIQFLYTGDYTFYPDPALNQISSCPLPTPPAPDAKLDVGHEISLIDRLLCHSRLNTVADYYDLPQLATLSTEKAQRILSAEWSVEAFCSLLEKTIGQTNNKPFLDMLATKAGEHAIELSGNSQIFQDGPIAEQIAPQALRTILREAKLNNGKIPDPSTSKRGRFR
ncbi:hypothetical protein F5Y18DRAFT_436301 [Xylariaceae sp. FL1019]|nr:hypothetical protein F5Y18DRAFT_436301 [Xylariaceae sp. FL1019]